MQTKAITTVSLLASTGLFYILDVNADVDGCYLIKKTPELATGKNLTAISWMKIKHKENNLYSLRGELTGANHRLYACWRKRWHYHGAQR